MKIIKSLARLAFKSAKADIDLARQQCQRSTALQQRRLINAVKAARMAIDCIDRGVLLPGHEAISSLPFSMPVTDEDALGMWHMFIAPAVRAAFPTMLIGRSGLLDVSPVATNAKGKLIDRNGKTLKTVEVKSDLPEMKPGLKLSGESARERDFMPEEELIEIERRIAADWSDLIGLLVESLGPDETQKGAKTEWSGGDDAAATKEKTSPEVSKAQTLLPRLKGKQRRVVELLISGNCSWPIKDIASDPAIGWKFPYKNAVEGIVKALNKRFGGLRLKINQEANSLRISPISKRQQKQN